MPGTQALRLPARAGGFDGGRSRGGGGDRRQTILSTLGRAWSHAATLLQLFRFAHLEAQMPRPCAEKGPTWKAQASKLFCKGMVTKPNLTIAQSNSHLLMFLREITDMRCAFEDGLDGRYLGWPVALAFDIERPRARVQGLPSSPNE